jgi:REP element-mobilizing transposase RayT
MMTRFAHQMQAPARPGWGGRRQGAGRKPQGARAGVTHLRRPRVAARFPAHVTVRVLPHVYNLRTRRAFRVVSQALFFAGDRFGMRVCELSVQGNHIHFVVEATDAHALSRGMQGLGVRLARGLNRMMGRSGRVFSDRFHARVLHTPLEAMRAVRYVRENRGRHLARIGGGRAANVAPAYAADPWSTASEQCGELCAAAHSSLLRRAQALA